MREVQTIKIEDQDYPEGLRKIIPAVKSIEYLGDIKRLISSKSLSVIGTRSITPYGIKTLKRIIPPLVRAGVTIISGFTRGVDTYAHRLAIENKIDGSVPTVAVLPHGILFRSSKEDRELSEAIVNTGGILMSEYQSHFPLQKWTLVQRNRIVAGLSSATVFVEGMYESGSMITVKYAHRFNRKVFAVPGDIFSRYSEGPNRVIADNQGELLADESQILSFLGFKTNLSSQQSLLDRPPPLSELNLQVYQIIRDGMVCFDDLISSTQVDSSGLSKVLTFLQIEGYINKIGDKYYAC